MPYPLTITATAMRYINRSAILEIIRRESPIARTTIAQKLDISLPTVMRIVDELIDEGFVRSHGDTEWSGGRRRPLLQFNADGYVVLGLDLSGSNLYGAASDLGGNIIYETVVGRHTSSGDENFERLVILIEKLLNSPQLLGRRVRGIAVGVPGITLHTEGIVRWAYAMNWRDFPLKAKLAERYELPIMVDNDANLAALGELWFGAGQNIQNMVYIALSTGIGAGLIIDGVLYRGATESSGEIGYMVPGREFLNKIHKGFGALENMASSVSILDRARRQLKSRREPDDLDKMLAEDIFQAAQQGQKWAWAVLDEAVDYLAVAIANLAAAFDPELIVLGGSLSPCADILVEPILSRIKDSILTLPKLVVSELGPRATTMGAITNVLHNTSNYYIVRKLS